MTDEYKNDFRHGVSESVQEAFPALTKAAHEMVVDEIMGSVEKGLDKKANWKEDLGSGMVQGAGKAITTLAAGALAGTTIHNFLKAKRNEELINQYAQFQGTLGNVAKRNELLANENKERIQELGNSIFNFAPTVANDPLVLETVMSNAVHGGGLDPQTVRSLQELEERYHKLREVEAPKTYVV